MKYIYVIAIVLIALLSACSSSVTPGTSNTGSHGASTTTISLSDNDLSVSLSPVSDKDTISGLPSVTFTSIPEGAAQILLILKPKNMPAADNPFTAPNVIAKFLEPNTHSATLETLSVENGEYELSVGISSSDGASGWLGEVKTDVVVKN